ncbi:MAG: sugar phosphate isomerase/epimerase family protein [Verrucomicrobiota bacterium]|nr:sugar phosphate isomerase/epimerase family protein [Verrucomicrobiota bacterium]
MNRRNFLLTTTGSFALSSFSVGQSKSFKGRIHKAVKFGSKPNEKRMKELKNLGFDGIEGSAPGLQVDEMKKACSKHELPMHGVVYNKHWKVRLSDPNPEVREASRVGLAQAMQEAKGVGGTSVLLVPGAVRGEKETHQLVWDRSIAQIRKLIPLAEELRIHILIETVWNGFCYKPEQFRDYIDEINSPWVQAYYDIGNMQKFAPSHEWIRILGKRTLKLDVKDWGSKNGFCPLGQGDVNWSKVRDELEKFDFKGWATREGNDGGVEKTAKLMNALLGL